MSLLLDVNLLNTLYLIALMSYHNQKRNRDDDSDSEYDHYDCPELKRTKRDEHINMLRYPEKYDNTIFIAGTREIHFNAHVDGDTICRIKKLISIIVDENKDKLVKFEKNGTIPKNRADDPPVTITILVNSPGGSVHDVLDFVDYINFLRCTFVNIKFTSIITGLVASAGTIMCVIADKKQMTRFAFAMIHELSTGMPRSNYTRILTYADSLKNVHNALITIYQECRGIDINDTQKTKELEELLIRETWMTPEQYKELGFIDEIIAHHRK